MKKIFFLLIATFLLTTFSFGQTAGGSVSVTFDIGRNSTGNCSKFGLCTKRTKIKVTISYQRISNNEKEAKEALDRTNLSSNQFNAIVFYDNQNLSFYLDQENVDVIKKYMNSEDLIIEEDFLYVDKENGINGFNIRKGNYNIAYDKEKDLYLIKF